MQKNIEAKIFILIKLMSLIMGATGEEKKTWDYEIKSISSTSSDPEKFKADLSVERISRGVYAISGDVLLNIDIVEGDSNHLAVKSFRSIQGDGDYKVLPFQVPEAHLVKIINTYYKDIVMETMKECSDLPYFNDEVQLPIEKKTYTLRACQFSKDGLPNHLQEGFYKVSLIGKGEVDWQLDIVAEVVHDL